MEAAGRAVAEAASRSRRPRRVWRLPSPAGRATTAATASWRRVCCVSRGGGCGSGCSGPRTALAGRCRSDGGTLEWRHRATDAGDARRGRCHRRCDVRGGAFPAARGVAAEVVAAINAVGQAGGGSRRAERTRRGNRRAPRRRRAGDAHRDVLPPEAGTSAAARAALVRRGAARRHRHPGTACWKRSRRAPSPIAPSLWQRALPQAAPRRAQVHARPRGGRSRARRRAPARPGSARAARCASAPGS